MYQQSLMITNLRYIGADEGDKYNNKLKEKYNIQVDVDYELLWLYFNEEPMITTQYYKFFLGIANNITVYMVYSDNYDCYKWDNLNKIFKKINNNLF